MKSSDVRSSAGRREKGDQVAHDISRDRNEQAASGIYPTAVQSLKLVVMTESFWLYT